jgi:hypothetical protein
VYISNIITPSGQRGWRSTREGWQTILTEELRHIQHGLNLAAFTRITTDINDPRLILEAPGKVARRELLLAVKKAHNTLKVVLHLPPQARANKSLIYFKAKRNYLRIDDRGDIVIAY